MNTGKVYKDIGGNDCTIHQMVQRDPAWAAVRVQEGEKAIAKLWELKDAWHDLIGNTAEPDAFGNVTIAEMDYSAFDKLITDCA